MAFRFRKSVKLMPGVRVNLSKSGVSTSLGGRGATWNVSKRGVRSTVGVPGTGLSWSTSSGSGRSRGRAPTRRQLEAAAKRARREELRQESMAIAEAHEEDLQDLVNAWRSVPAMPSQADIDAACMPQGFEPDPDPKPPDPTAALAELRGQITEDVHKAAGSAWLVPVALLVGSGTLSALLAVAGTAIGGALNSGALAFALAGGGALAPVAVGAILALLAWARRRAKIAREIDVQVDAGWDGHWTALEQDYENAVQQHREDTLAAKEAWDQAETVRAERAKRLARGDTDILAESLEFELAMLDFPFEAICQVAVPDSGHAYVLLDLPEIEDVIPEKKLKVLKSGERREVNRPSRERQEPYAHLVCGLTLQVAQVALCVGPTLESVTVAGYTQRRGRDGAINDEYVIEMPGTRGEIGAFDFQALDPVQLLTTKDGARIKLTKTSKMSKIKAPTWTRGE